jgi:hypothetical protein
MKKNKKIDYAKVLWVNLLLTLLLIISVSVLYVSSDMSIGKDSEHKFMLSIWLYVWNLIIPFLIGLTSFVGMIGYNIATFVEED